MKRWIGGAGIILVGALVVIQFVSIERTNPPVEGDIQTSAELKAVLRRACYDCHSNETVWPWYSHIAPVSFLVANDVKEGRKELNFSTWDQYDEQRKARKLKEIVEQIEENKMPQWYYILMHPETKLSESDKEIILKWAKKPLRDARISIK